MNLKFQNFNYENHKSEQRDLFKESFPEIKNLPSASSEHYNWKHRGQIQSFQFSAILDQKLIGYYAALSYKYKFNNNYIKTGMVCDVMTGKESRGKGVFTKLGKYSTDSFYTLEVWKGAFLKKRKIMYINFNVIQ